MWDNLLRSLFLFGCGRTVALRPRRIIPLVGVVAFPVAETSEGIHARAAEMAVQPSTIASPHCFVDAF